MLGRTGLGALHPARLGAARRGRGRRGRRGPDRCPPPWTTSWFRATRPRSRPGRWRATSATSAVPARRRGVPGRRHRLPLHLRPRSAARWTSAGPRRGRSTRSSTTCRGPLCRSRSATSSTTHARTSVPLRSAMPRPSCAPTTRPPSRRAARPPGRLHSACAGWLPTVVVSTTPIDVLLPPAPRPRPGPGAGGGGGPSGSPGPDARARTPRPRSGGPVRRPTEAAQSAAAVAAIRAGDQPRRPRRRQRIPTTTPAAALTALREAVEAKASVGSATGTTTAPARADRDPGPGRGRLAHGVRPPARGPPRFRRAPDHRGPGGGSCLSGRPAAHP